MRLIAHFVSGSTARCAALLVGVNNSTAAYYFHRLRELILYSQEQEVDEVFGGELELDESFFGGARKGKRGIDSAGKVTVFGLLKRGGKGYNALDMTQFKHNRINHSQLFANKTNHTNGIENFWSQAKCHMRKFNGVTKDHFPLYLKECEWCFNNPHPKQQLLKLKQLFKRNVN